MVEKSHKKFDIRLGKTFQDFRLSKDISSDEVCKGVCARKTLWNFENGICSIKYTYLLKLAQNINVPVEEIELAANDYPINEHEAFYETIVQYYFDKNIEMLKDILAAKKHAVLTNKENYLYVLYIADLIHDLDPNFLIPEDILQKAAAYLMDVSIWGYNELDLFSHTLHLLTVDLTASLTKDVIKNKKVFLVDNRKKKCLIKTLANALFFFMKNDYLKDIPFFLDAGYSLLPKHKLFSFDNEKRYLNFMHGFYLLIIGKEEEGRQIMMDIIHQLLAIGNKLIASQFHRCYDEAIIKLYNKNIT
ncbi:MAG: hypothetical protein LBL38_00305 [Lactobacillales bacterium]|nr:hypothetical protein [Lactobacillales bacterium]